MKTLKEYLLSRPETVLTLAILFAAVGGLVVAPLSMASSKMKNERAVKPAVKPTNIVTQIHEDGHSYVIVHVNGVPKGITHSAACPCHKQAK
jgi:hypothetical protein